MVETLISKNAEAVCDKDTGCDMMFRDKKLDELENLFRHFKRDPHAYKHIINKMSPYLLEIGEKKFCDEALLKDAILFTQNLLDFKLWTDEMLHYAFDNNSAFQAARDQCFMTFMNKSLLTPKHLATFTDKLLRTGLNGASEDEADK